MKGCNHCWKTTRIITYVHIYIHIHTCTCLQHTSRAVAASRALSADKGETYISAHSEALRNSAFDVDAVADDAVDEDDGRGGDGADDEETDDDGDGEERSGDERATLLMFRRTR